MGSARVVGITGPQLIGRTEGLDAALSSGADELEPGAVARAREVIAKVRARTGLTGNHTVVAFAGATGSGKSSLFNAVVGSPVATIGARRPTTSTPTAAVWGGEDATALLDWLGVGKRHVVQPGAALPVPESLDGLVLLDLPDFDSRETSNRAEAERMLDLVDVFVWVTDPQKYADARMHDDYVAALATHEAVTLVVLNQADRLTPEQAQQCADDLRRLLVMDGLSDARVLLTSAATGVGIEDLRGRLANAVAGRNAARTRLAADVTAATIGLSGGVAPGEHDISAQTRDGLVDALARAAGIPTVVSAVDRDYRHQAVARTGWPFTRWVRSFRPRPLRRLRLDEAAPGVTEADVRAVVGRSSLPPPSPAARAAVDLASRRLGDDAASGLPVRWADAVHEAAAPDGHDLADALDQSIVGTSLKVAAPRWWGVMGMLQLLLALTAVAGLLWLVVLSVLGWLRLPEPSTPTWGPLPVPFVLLAGGLVAGVLLALLSRYLAGVGARRRAASVDRWLRGAVSRVAEERVLGPVGEVLSRHAATRQALDRARG